jgi:hypothetical protein
MRDALQIGRERESWNVGQGTAYGWSASDATDEDDDALIVEHGILDSTFHSDALTGSVLQGDIIVGNATPKWSRLAKGASGSFVQANATDAIWSGWTLPLTAPAAGNYLRDDGTWQPVAAAPNALLDGSAHSDTIAAAVVRGSLIYGNATPKWAALAVGASGRFLQSDGTDAAWSGWSIPLTAPNVGNFLRDDGTWAATPTWGLMDSFFIDADTGGPLEISDGETIQFTGDSHIGADITGSNIVSISYIGPSIINPSYVQHANVTATGTMTMTASRNIFVPVTASVANIVLTIPNGTQGFIYTFKRLDNTVYTITLTPTAGVDGTTSVQLKTQWDSITLMYTGGTYYVI